MTGSSALLGATLARRLVDEGWSVEGVDSEPGRLTTVVADIRTPGLWKRLLNGTAAVFHTASLHVPDLDACPDSEFAAVNVLATEALLDVAVQKGVGAFVYTSTTSVYGQAMVPANMAVFVTEDLQPEPRDVYDTTKLAAERLCRDAAMTGLRVTCLRVARFFSEPLPVRLIHRLHRGVAVADAADAHVAALRRDGAQFGIFNVSARSPFDPSDAHALVTNPGEVIARMYPGVPTRLERLGYTLPRSIDRVYVIDSAARAFGYSPRENFLELIRNIELGLADDSSLGGLRPCA